MCTSSLGPVIDRPKLEEKIDGEAGAGTGIGCAWRRQDGPGTAIG